MNQQQNHSQGGQSQRQGAQPEQPEQQQQAVPEQGDKGEHLIDEDDGIPGSDDDGSAKPRTGSDDERS